MKKKIYAGILLFIAAALLIAQGPLQKVKLWDTNNSHALELRWNENDTAARTLNFLVSGADRSYTITGNSTNNQDVSTAGSPTHPTLYLTTRLFVNETANTNQTRGITVNQGATADDQVLAFKADAVVHGMTDVVETNTWGQAHIFSSTDGGMSLDGFTEQITGVGIGGHYTVGDTTSDSTSRGAVGIYAYKKSGTGQGNVLATENMLVVRPWIGGAYTTVYAVKASGNTWQVGNADIDGSADIGTTLQVGGNTTLLGNLDVASGENIHAHQIYINDTSNIHQTSGLTIYQATDEILSLKFGIAHGMTSLTETDTDAYFDPVNETNGGIQFVGLTKDVVGMSLVACATNDNVTKSSAGTAPIRLTIYKKSGTTIGDPGADANLVSIWKGVTAQVWGVDEDGDTWQGGTITAGSLAGVLKGTAGLVSAIANTTAADYLGGDAAYHTLNQAAVAGLTTADSPVFATVKLSGLTDGYVPYHVADATGLANSSIYTDGTSVFIGATAAAAYETLLVKGGINNTSPYRAVIASFRTASYAQHLSIVGDASGAIGGMGIQYGIGTGVPEIFITTNYVGIGTKILSASEIFHVGGDLYSDGNGSFLSITDRTAYPKNKTVAYDAVKSHRKKSDKDELDHDALIDFVKFGNGRNLSATVSSLCEVVKDLIERINVLEKKK